MSTSLNYMKTLAAIEGVERNRKSLEIKFKPFAAFEQVIHLHVVASQNQEYLLRGTIAGILQGDTNELFCQKIVTATKERRIKLPVIAADDKSIILMLSFIDENQNNQSLKFFL